MKVQDIKQNLICKGDYLNVADSIYDSAEFVMIKDFEIHSDTDATVVLVGGRLRSIQEISEDDLYLESEIH